MWAEIAVLFFLDIARIYVQYTIPEANLNSYVTVHILKKGIQMANIPIGVDLSGKVVALTGGAGILGSCIGMYLARAGANVAILDISDEMGKKAADMIKEDGGKAEYVNCNVLERESVSKAADEIEKLFGPVDILVNGAGGNSPKATSGMEELTPETVKEALDDEKSFFNMDDSGFRFVFDLNFIGTLLPTQVFTKRMAERGKGTVLNISSMSAFKPLTKVGAYSAAKAAISNFTEWLATHFAKLGIRVNAIAPGFFDTNQNHFLLFNEDETLSERGNKIIAGTPMGRFGKPEELIGTVLWLLSEEAAGFVTGIVVPIDGGYNAYSGV